MSRPARKRARQDREWFSRRLAQEALAQWNHESRIDAQHDIAGEMRAERKPLPELAVVDDAALRHDAAVAAQNASDAAGRMEKAVARGFNLTEATGIRPLPMHELTPEERAAARRMGETLLTDPQWENLHDEIRRILARLGE